MIGVRPSPGSPTRGERPYQRRRNRPIMITSAVLAVLAVAAWGVVLVSTPGGRIDTTCSPPADGSSVGTVVDRTELDAATPAPPGDVRYTVLNAGDQRGQANLVAAQLGDLQFSEATSPTNDPRYPQGDLDCVGQLRYGQRGEASAATLALELPCVELVRDNRPDPGVDVVVGAAFTDVAPGRAARDVLDQLAAPPGDNGRPAGVDQAALDQARAAVC